MRVQHETCSTICGTHVQAILDQKNLTGLAGGVREGQNMAHLGHFNGKCAQMHYFIFIQPSSLSSLELILVATTTTTIVPGALKKEGLSMSGKDFGSPFQALSQASSVGNISCEMLQNRKKKHIRFQD